MSDFIESILQSVDIIIDKRLEDVAYDSTIICTIIDDSDKKNGKYRVSDGSVTYVAYSDQNNYKKGDQIRMSVPMGDFSQKKFIIGKYVTDSNTEPITYVSPADTVLNISGNFANGITGSILANGSVTEKELWGAALDEKIISLQSNNLYNTIVLSCNFKTDLVNYQMTSGNYGLRLDFVTRPSLKSEHVIINRITLDSSEMFGNPYLFAINSPQAKVIKLDTFGIVEGMSLKLYQKGNFRDNKENLIPTYNGQPDNIFVNNIAIGMGCDLTLLEDNKLQLYTDDGITYKYNTHTDETNLKTMGILWINKDDENRYVGFSDGIYDPTYDELEYLEKSKVNARLVKYKGKEGIPLDEESLNLAANIDEAAAAITKAVNVVNRDLVKVLREFQTMVTNVTALSDNIGLLLNLSNEEDNRYLGNRTSAITSDLSNLRKMYKEVLQYGYEKINPPKVNALKWEDLTLGEYHNTLKSQFENIKVQIAWLLGVEEGQGCEGVTDDGLYSGYKSIYDSFKIRIEKIVAMMWGHLNMATGNYTYLNNYFPDSFFTEDFTILQGYKDKTNFTPYKEPDLSSYDNKYCIYWYRYEKGYKTPASEQLLPEEWRRLNIHDAYRQVKNLTEENFKKGIFYILKDGEYVKATEWKSEEENDDGEDIEVVYYKCISEVDEDKINIGLPSIYYYTEDLDRKWKYEKITEYREDLLYYDDKFNLVNNPIETDVAAGKYYVKVCMNDDGKSIHDLKPSPGNGTLTQYMQHDLAEEKYMVVLFYNHTMYKSNELIFTNEDIIPDKTTLDKGDILIFEHLDNSVDDYQSYAITNYLMDERDASLNRAIRCHYDGLLAKDNAFVGGQIYWYVPRQSTMIEINETLLKQNGFVFDEARSDIVYKPVKNFIPVNLPQEGEEITEINSTEYQENNYRTYQKDMYYTKDEGKDFYRLATLDYNEDVQYYEKIETELCFYKTIKACLKSQEEIDKAKYEWDKWIFSESQSSSIDNRDFWYKIKPYYQESQNNYLRCEFIKTEESDSVFGQQLFTFGVAGTSGTKYTLAITKGNGKTSTTDVEALPFQAQLKDANNNPLDFTIATKEQFSTTWEFITPEAFSGNKTAITHLDRNNVEGWFEASAGSCGIIKVLSRINLTGASLTDGETEIVENENGEEESLGRQRLVDLTTLCAVPWALGDYYIDGPLQIIYNSLGTLDSTSMNNISYKLFTKQDIRNDEIIPDTDAGHAIDKNKINWEIKLYIKDKSPGSDKFILLKNENPYKKEYEFYIKYMPKIFDNTLVPAPLYLDGLDCYAVVEASVGNQVLWKQPLIILQNRYSSSTLNDWDGSFQIDEDNGTIMGTMFGAGRKTDNNTFEGVLMGDVGVGANMSLRDGNKSGLGVYGFHDGAQSFGLNIDGTAFFGKAGRGRVLIDGNNSQISSASYNQIDSAGMLIDLDDGFIDMKSAKKMTNENWSTYKATHPEVSEFNTYQDYEDRHGPLYVKEGESSQIHLSVTDPYFYIKNNLGKTLMYIGNTEISENYNSKYFLQTSNYSDTNSARTGARLDLDKGFLRVYGQNSSLILNTDPVAGSSGINKYYFYVGESSSQYISFTKGTSGSTLSIKAQNFNLHVANKIGTSDVYNKILLNSAASGTSGDSQYYFYIGKSNSDEYLQYKADGTIGIKTKSLILNARTNFTANSKSYQKGIYLNSSPGNSGSYLWIGNSQLGNVIRVYNNSNSTSINFMLTAGANNTDDYLALFSNDQSSETTIGSCTATEKKQWRIVAGKNFGVTKAGKLYASGANISGNIYADYIKTENGKIGGWTVTGSSLNNGSTYLNSNGTIKGAAISGGSINISKGSYYLQMGIETDHPSVSGLNVKAGGINMHQHGISNCTDIGGYNGTLHFGTNGISTTSAIHLGDHGNIKLNAGSGASVTLLTFINNAIEQYLEDHGVSSSRNVAELGGNHIILADTGVHFTFTNGLLTNVYSVNNDW